MPPPLSCDCVQSDYPKLPQVQTSWKPGTEQNLASMQAQRTVDSLLRHEPCDRAMCEQAGCFFASLESQVIMTCFQQKQCPGKVTFWD